MAAWAMWGVSCAARSYRRCVSRFTACLGRSGGRSRWGCECSFSFSLTCTTIARNANGNVSKHTLMETFPVVNEDWEHG
jgi:hypothetical protein